MPADVAAALRRALPASEILTEAGALAAYGRDWSELGEPRPAVVVLPRSAGEVAELVAFARRERVGLVPSGGRTGLSGGALALAGEVVVALDRMDRILELSRVDRTLRVEAGAVTRAVQEHAAENGLYFPVDFASAASSQIGGNLATNAGGIHVVRYGMFRDWVAGLKVVTGRGDLLDLNRGLVKNATGYDLRHLLIGSEGTLGIIVEATLRLTSPPDPRQVMLLALPGLGPLLELFVAFRDALRLCAFELFSADALGYVLAATGLPPPFAEGAPFYALIETDAPDEAAREAALAVAAEAVERGQATDVVVAEGETDARRLWRLREEIAAAVSPHHPYRNDLSVIPSRVPAFLADVEAVVTARYPGFSLVWFGHIGDGNLHLDIVKPEGLSREEFVRRCEAVNDDLFAVVERHGGSISAEHGVGLLKKPYLGYSRSAEEIACLAGIKSVFDPDGIMNPGKLVDGG